MSSDMAKVSQILVLQLFQTLLEARPGRNKLFKGSIV